MAENNDTSMDSDGYFGKDVAATYDDDRAIFRPEVIDPVVDFLYGLAGSGPALEFGIGTGRIAIPLAQRGIEVCGIDLSKAMIDKLREKPAAATLHSEVGDFATTRMDRSFSLVYLIFNTISNLTTQEAQVACFRNAAAHLQPGGTFVIELFIPRLQWLPPGETRLAFDVSERHWGIDEYEVATQSLTSHHVVFTGDRTRRMSIPFRYVWPAELDLMAQLAGMKLKARWGGWNKEPFTRDSTSHVSVWEKVH